MDISKDTEADIDQMLANKNKSQKVRNRNLYLAAFVALNGWTMVGFTLAYTSPAVPDMQEKGILKTDQQSSWFSSLMAIGAIFGGPAAGYSLGMFGRKFSMMLCSLPLVLGYTLILSLENIPALYIGRILTGVGTGMMSLTSPVYIAELSSSELRGTLIGPLQMFIAFGLLLVNALGISLSYVWLALVGCTISAILLIMLLFMPETPHYCIMKKDRTRALSVLVWLRGEDYDSEQEYNDISNSIKANSSEFRYRELLQPDLYIPLTISLALMIIQQFGGIAAVTSYAVIIFQSSSPSMDDHVAAIIVAGVQVIATFISILLIEKAGRRILLIVAGIGMFISATTFGLYYKLTENGTTDLTWLSLTSLVVYTSFFSLAWGSIPWLVMPEIFPTRARATASGIATIVNWLSAFVVTKEFFEMSTTMTHAGVFWFYAGVCLFGVFFVAFCVPETKGKSLEEISLTFQRHNKGCEI